MNLFGIDKKMRFVHLLILVLNVALAFEGDLEINETPNREEEQQPQVITGTVNVTAYIGDTATLPCEVANLGNHHVNWLKIERDSPITLTVGYHQFSRNMRFRVARVNHNHHHHHQRHKQQNNQDESIAVNNNQESVLPATASSSVPLRIESWNFEIRKVSPEDQGLYECYIKINSKHKTKANVYLTVKSEKEKSADSKSGSSSYYSNNYIFENPRSERLASSSVERIDLPPNNWVKLRCNATGVISLSSRSSNNQPNYDLQWYKDDNLIEQDSRRLKKWVSSYDDSNYMELDIYAVEPEDSGLYQCRRDKTILKNVLLHVMGNKGLRSIVSTDYLIALLSINLVFLFATI